MDNFKNLPLRKGVGIILLNKKNKIFVGKRIDNPHKYWQMPQGGVGHDEPYFLAAKRELEEETGVKNIELIKEIEKYFIYKLPSYLMGKIWKGRYSGQKQKWFIMRFTGSDSEINLETKKPEFLDWKWINMEDLPKVVVKFKVKIYKKLKNEIQSLNLY